MRSQSNPNAEEGLMRINWQLVLIGVFVVGFLIYLGSGAHFGTVRMVPRILN